MIRVLVSACLLGERVRYHGGDARLEDSILERWVEEGRVVPFCPEVAGGLTVPRPPAELVGGDGRAVVASTGRVVTATGSDVTDAFLAGARLALQTVRERRVGLAVLVDGSPSCGSRRVYDGTFAGVRQAGVGVTTALLESHGLRVFGEDRLVEASDYLAGLEASANE